MSNFRPSNRDERLRNAVTRAAHLTLNTLGQPEEEPHRATDAAAAPPKPPPPAASLDNLMLPSEIHQLLDEPLQNMGFVLKPTRTPNSFTKKMIHHHIIEAAGKKMVLMYVDPALLESSWSEINSLGFVFNGKFGAAYVFSKAEKLDTVYKTVLSAWQSAFFQDADIFLEEDIEDLKRMDGEFLEFDLKERFSLPAAGAASETAVPVSSTFDRERLKSLMVNAFSSDELNSLSYSLGVDYDNFGGLRAPKETAVVEMIEYFERNGMIDRLITACQNKRPLEDWSVSSQ